MEKVSSLLPSYLRGFGTVAGRVDDSGRGDWSGGVSIGHLAR